MLFMTLTQPDQQAPWHPSGDGLPTYQEIIRGDAVPPSEGNTLYEVSWVPMGSEDVSKDRYISQEYLDREIEQVWKRTWQPVCHEAQVLKVGDVHLYEVVGLSVLVTRVGEDSSKAFHNS